MASRAFVGAARPLSLGLLTARPGSSTICRRTLRRGGARDFSLALRLDFRVFGPLAYTFLRARLGP
jgi:hypothetical protein